MNSFLKRFMKNKGSQERSEHQADELEQQSILGTNYNLEYGDIKQVDEITRIFQSLAKSISPEQQYTYDDLSRYTLISLALFDAVSTGIMLVEKDGRVALINRSAKGWLGYDPEDDLRGCDIDDVLGNSPEFIDLILRSLRTGESVSRREIRFLTHDGKSVTLGATLSPVKSEKGETEAVVVVFARIPQIDEAGGTSPLKASCFESKVIECLERLEKKITDLIRQAQKEESCSGANPSDAIDELRWIRSCLHAFHLRENQSAGIIEWVDLNSLIMGIVDTLGLKGSQRLRISLQGGLPNVPIERNIIEKAIEYLILGSLKACKDAIAIETRHDPLTSMVSVRISELGESPELIGIHCSLSDYISSNGCYRELGLMLLRLSNRQTVSVTKHNGFYCFSLSILVPKKTKAGQKRAV